MNIRKCYPSHIQTSIDSSVASIPVLILHPYPTEYSLYSIWQARQLNNEVHILYDHQGTIQKHCKFNQTCFLSFSSQLDRYFKSFRSSKVFFIDLNSHDLSNEIKDFKLLFSLGNNKSVFDRYHPDKWIYEEWCAVRWLYAYNYAVFRKFDVIYIQDSDVLLYGNVSIEFEYLQPLDVAISGSYFVPGSSGHNAFFRVKTLRTLIDLMRETWKGRTDLSDYVSKNLVTDMFYFTHLFEYLNNHVMRRAKGVIVRLLDDIYYGENSRMLARVFDRTIIDDAMQRFPFRNVTFQDGSSENLKDINWLTTNGQIFNRSHMSSTLPVRYPIIYHNELQANVRMITIHFVGCRKKYLHFYIQRYIKNNQLDILLQLNIFPNRTLIY